MWKNSENAVKLRIDSSSVLIALLSKKTQQTIMESSEIQLI
jgi:hypothetical protein